MAKNHSEYSPNRRHALEFMMWAGTGILWVASGGIWKQFIRRSEAASTVAQTTPTIPIIVKDTTAPYWRRVLAGARKAGQDLGVNIAELDAASGPDIDTQTNLVWDTMAPNAAAIVIAPAQSAILGKAAAKVAGKFKIVGIDSADDGLPLTSMVGNDHAAAGRAAADILAERIQKTYADAEGDVALITALPGVAALEERARGFKEQIASKYGALSIVAERIGDGQARTGRSIMTDIISSYPELRGVFAADAITALGAGEAVAESKTNKTGDKINVVGFDADERLVKFLQDGTIAALIVQDPFRMGYEAVKAALAAAKGEQVPVTIHTGVSAITRANMNSARAQELLNPPLR
jgi:ribose transport system substrate-binding protein